MTTVRRDADGSLRFSGVAPGFTPVFTLGAGVATFRLVHGGTGAFRARLLSRDGQVVEELAVWAGALDGGRALPVPSTGEYLLDVQATGAWSAEVAQLSARATAWPPALDGVDEATCGSAEAASGRVPAPLAPATERPSAPIHPGDPGRRRPRAASADDDREFLQRRCRAGAHRRRPARDLLDAVIRVPRERRADRAAPEAACADEDGDSYPRLRSALAGRHLRLLFGQAHYWSKRTRMLTWGDHVSNGLFGLLRAADRYDPSHGVSFAGYALIWLRSTMRRGALLQEPLVRRPLDDRFAGAWEMSYGELFGAAISLSDASPDEADDLLAAAARRRHLDEVAAFSEGPELADALAPLLAELSARQQEVLRRRFVLEQTLEDAGRSMGISRERIRQLEVLALDRLRARPALREIARARGWDPDEATVRPRRRSSPGDRCASDNSEPNAPTSAAKAQAPAPQPRTALRDPVAADWALVGDVEALLASPSASSSARALPGASGVEKVLTRLGVVGLADLLRLSLERARACPGSGPSSVKRLAFMRREACARLRAEVERSPVSARSPAAVDRA